MLPFCTFNVFPEVYRDKAQKQYSIPTSEWEKTHPGWSYPKDKYMRDTKAIEATEAYIKTYGKMVDYFALPINGGVPVKNFSNPAAKKVVPPITQKAMVVQTVSSAGTKTEDVVSGSCEVSAKAPPSHAHAHTHSSKESKGESCGCGTTGGCGCGKNGSKEGGSCGCGSGGCC